MKKNNIALVIYPTRYGDYDVLAIGDCSLLRELKKKNKYYDLIKSSKFGGMSLLVIDTCDTLKDAMSCIKECRKLWRIIEK